MLLRSFGHLVNPDNHWNMPFRVGLAAELPKSLVTQNAKLC